MYQALYQALVPCASGVSMVDILAIPVE